MWELVGIRWPLSLFTAWMLGASVLNLLVLLKNAGVIAGTGETAAIGAEIVLFLLS